MAAPANDNRPAAPAPQWARHVPIIGVIGEGGRVTITDPTWRPTPAPPFPNDPREA